MRLRAEQPRCSARAPLRAASLRAASLRAASLRALFVRVAAALAFALSMLIPFRASAAIIPACEHDAMTQVPTSAAPASPMSADPSCDASADADHAGDPNAAPMCGEQGVSAVAPPRLLPIADARIDAGPACAFVDASRPMIGPKSGDHSLLQSPAIVEHAMLGLTVLVPAAPFVEMVGQPAASGGPHAGFDDGVYHPPR